MKEKNYNSPWSLKFNTAALVQWGLIISVSCLPAY